MNWYQDTLLPWVVDLACSCRAVGRLRAEVVPLVRGRVLEVGLGSGLNLPYYRRGSVEIVYGLEPSESMRHKASEQLQKTELPVQILNSPAEDIPLPDQSIDSVLLTFTLCTITDWRAGLHEMRRVLRTGGQLIFCEHGLAPDRAVRAWQNRINPYWSCLAGGCNLNRPIPQLLAEAGFRVETLTAGYVRGVPRLAGYVYRGTATKGPRPLDPSS